MRLEQIDQFRWRLPREGGMRVDGIVYADDRPGSGGYLAAMAAAANFAFANRQVMTHWARESLTRALGVSHAQAGIETLYDVCHNIAKFETFELDGQTRRLCVHRKGATRPTLPGTHRPRPRTGTWASR